MVVKIKPISILNLVADTIETRVIQYDLDSGSCRLFWQLRNDQQNLMEGNHEVPASVVAKWGDDDFVIIDDLLGALHLER